MAVNTTDDGRRAPARASARHLAAPAPATTKARTRGSRKRGAVDHAPQPSKERTYASIATRLAIGSQHASARTRLAPVGDLGIRAGG